jgi:hypothetical protein
MARPLQIEFGGAVSHMTTGGDACRLITLGIKSDTLPPWY